MSYAATAVTELLQESFRREVGARVEAHALKAQIAEHVDRIAGLEAALAEAEKPKPEDEKQNERERALRDEAKRLRAELAALTTKKGKAR